MIRTTARSAAMLALLASTAPMLAADAPLVDPPMRAGSYHVTVGEMEIGGNLPEGAAEGVRRSLGRDRTLCLDPRPSRGRRPVGLIEEFAGSACKPERASVDGNRFNGRLACANETTYGFTSYEGSFAESSADIELAIDMSFRNNDTRLFLTAEVKFEWQSETCD